MVLRLLLLVGVVLLVMQWRRKLRLVGERARRARQGRAAEPVQMVACSACGVHLPRSEAVAADGAAGPMYCCVAHRAADLARGGR